MLDMFDREIKNGDLVIVHTINKLILCVVINYNFYYLVNGNIRKLNIKYEKEKIYKINPSDKEQQYLHSILDLYRKKKRERNIRRKEYAKKYYYRNKELSQVGTRLTKGNFYIGLDGCLYFYIGKCKSIIYDREPLFIQKEHDLYAYIKLYYNNKLFYDIKNDTLAEDYLNDSKFQNLVNCFLKLVLSDTNIHIDTDYFECHFLKHKKKMFKLYNEVKFNFNKNKFKYVMKSINTYFINSIYTFIYE